MVKASVTVVIPTYNSMDFLQQTLETCFNQSIQPLEIIVVDDGSSDDTRARLEANYTDRIRYIYQSNAGPATARNRGIREARGDFIKFLDADDQMSPDHIEKCLAVFEKADEKTAVVYTRYVHVEKDGITPVKSLSDPPLLSGDIFCPFLMSNGISILTSASMVRRSACIEIGLFDESPEILGVEDWDFYLKLAEKYHFQAIDEILLRYRRHDRGLTARSYEMARGRLKTIQNIGQSPRLTECMNRDKYNQLLAGRYHVFAIESWAKNKRRDTRDAFRQAIQLTATARYIRMLFFVLSYVLPVDVAYAINQLLERSKA